MQKFSIKEAIKFGWDAMKTNFWFFVGMLLIVWVIQFVPNILKLFVTRTVTIELWASIIIFFIQIAAVLLSLLIGIGVTKVILGIIAGIKPTYRALFLQYSILLNYIIGAILSGIIIGIGFILLIIPGIIISIRLQFWPYFIIDKKLGPIEALKESVRITKKETWCLFKFGIIILGIQILGMLALLVGLFASIPTTIMAHAFVYKKLSGEFDVVQGDGVLQESEEKSTNDSSRLTGASKEQPQSTNKTLVAALIIVLLVFGGSMAYIYLPQFLEGKGFIKTVGYIIDIAMPGDVKKAGRDARRVADIKQIQLALEIYFDSNGEYPDSLAKLAPKFIPSVPQDPLGWVDYRYNSYTTTTNPPIAADDCRETYDTCILYHIGANLEDSTNQALSSDADAVGDIINGTDIDGCNNEADRYCFDEFDVGRQPVEKKTQTKITPQFDESGPQGSSSSLDSPDTTGPPGSSSPLDSPDESGPPDP